MEGAELGLSDICTRFMLDLRLRGDVESDRSVPVLSVSSGGSSGSYTCSVTCGVPEGKEGMEGCEGGDLFLKLTLRLEEGYI